MLEQAEDFRAESEALFGLVRDLPESAFVEPTAFKDWTIDRVLGHLHMWNWAADLSLTDADQFKEFMQGIMRRREAGENVGDVEREWRDGIGGQALVAAWRDYYQGMADRFAKADPSARVPWAGPSMSVRSSISARLMETWAHGQEVYDMLGVVRQNADRIKSIAVLGVNTHGWTYMVRDRKAPTPAPHVRLTAPSGAIWTWNDPSETELIEGAAEDFCQVVTQVRNIADTKLSVTGPNATEWMSMAQCFAGAPETPPAPGARRTMPRA
ncbi:MAG: TIGR03084 family metal-binding protein [Minwuia sp.]|nr:TIGR03084 family metal-binding protein [Minwuia sp.]